MSAALWRASGQPVGGANELVDPTLPVVDPVLTTLPNREGYVETARKQRRNLAHRYLRDWNNRSMHIFDREAKMSQFGGLWRSFTCGQLEKLLEDEYPETNLPHVIRGHSCPTCNHGDHRNDYLEQNFTFIATVYWGKLPEMLPGLFQNPVESDAVAYAEVRMFIPRRRLVWLRYAPGSPSQAIPLGGVPGEYLDLAIGDEPEPIDDGQSRWRVGFQGVPTHWDLLNQHWTCQLVPATQSSLADVLQTPPPLPTLPSAGNGTFPTEWAGDDVVLPNLGDLTSEDITRISPH
jgi:hypothetical protein